MTPSKCYDSHRIIACITAIAFYLFSRHESIMSTAFPTHVDQRWKSFSFQKWNRFTIDTWSLPQTRVDTYSRWNHPFLFSLQHNHMDDYDSASTDSEWFDFFGDSSHNTRKKSKHVDDTDPVLQASKLKPPSSTHFFSQKNLSDSSFILSTDTISPNLSPSVNQTQARTLFQSLCQAAGIHKPSRIQALAWPSLIHGHTAILADQTGSGKTLAYLFPLLQRMMLLDPHNTTTTAHGTTTTTRRKLNGAPKILILAPTAELADQIHQVCTSISNTMKGQGLKSFVTKVITASGKMDTDIRDQIRMIQSHSMDVLISTPGRISTILRTKHCGLDLTSHLQTIVLDEVDILFMDETFGPQLQTIGQASSSSSRPVQFVFVTATLPDSVIQKVKKEFPLVRLIQGPGLHRIASTIQEHLVDVSIPPSPTTHLDPTAGFEIKAQQLMKALRSHRCMRTLIFCNTVESCRMVENLISRMDRRKRIWYVGAYHNAMTAESRLKNLHIFVHGFGSKDASSSEPMGTLSAPIGNGNIHRHRDSSSRSTREQKKMVPISEPMISGQDSIHQVLICTDRAARGVDFDARPVDHVILFDFPKDPAEYVRRVGRTGRAGRQGTVTVFAYGWQLPIARKIMGSQLESFTVASQDEDQDTNMEEYDNKQRRDPKRRGEKDKTIKGNIEGGHLWK